ncbi:MAG: DivIVA domain-containing protein [Acidimicrobiia bacterium]|nr:DivIVA domain-containing protein [Acidimicrobiia bacterium]
MPNRPSFEYVRRGYDPDTVDAHLTALEGALNDLRAQAKEATVRANTLQRQIETAGQAQISVEAAFLELADTKASMLENARSRAEAILAEAQEQAATMTEQPQETLDKAWVEADAILDGARKEVSKAREEAAALLESAHRKADVTVTDARHEALRLLAQAKTEAEGVVTQAHSDHETLMRSLRELQRTVISMLEHGRGANPEVGKVLADDATRVVALDPEPIT